MFPDININYIVIVVLIIVIIFIFYNINSLSINTFIRDKTETKSEIKFLNDKKYKVNTITDLLKFNSRDNPKNIALCMKKDNVWEEINYKKYYNMTKNFAESINYFLGPNVNVGIIGFNSPGWFYGHLGTMINGGISIGMYTTLSPDGCEYIIKDANIELLLVEDSKQLEKFINLNIPSVKAIIYYSPIKEDLINKFSVPVLGMTNFMTKRGKKLPIINSNDIATIIYTSGTTSNPKGVSITHKNIMSNIKNVSKFLKDFSNIKLVIGERFVSYLPLNHIAAQMMDIYMPIALVGTVWFADNNALKNSLVTTLKDCYPTIFMGVPRIWEKIKEQIEKELSNHFAGDIYKYFASGNIIKNIGLDHCKLCVSGAGVLPNSVADFFESIGITLYDLYGMSETTGIISMSCPNRYKKGSVGKPLMRVMIDKDKEILVKGDNLFSGYYGKKNLTKESMKNGWFKTGDLGFIDNDGYLFIIGRKKELIVTSGGENIAPVLIEDKIINELKIFDYVVVIGDKKKFLSVILVPKIEKGKLISDFLDIDDNLKDIDEINNSEYLNNYISNKINIVNNNAISNANKIQKWYIVPHKFAIGNELTPTLKLKRSFISEKYKKQINQLYESND